MAIIFDLYIECATPEELAEIKAHFSGLSFKLQNGKVTHWDFSPDDTEGVHSCSYWSRQLSNSAVRTVTDAIECSEAGVRLYQHLHQGPDFQFARVAWEATLISGLELEDYLEPLGDTGESRLEIQCAFTEAQYEKLGRPKYCKAFRPGYVWTGYRGEEYRPLWSSDQQQLNDLYRKYFSQTD